MDQLKEKSRKAFDAQAADYDRTEKGAHARRLYPHVLAALDGVREGELLDVGCGTGALARLVLEQGPKRRVTGVDLAPGMVAHARASLAAFGDRARIAEADSERLPFHEESFDAAYCNDTFHHYPDPGKAVFEIWRVMRPGGLLVVGDCTLPAPVRAVMNASLRFSSEGDVHIYSKGEYERILGRWFSSVAWRRVEGSACLVEARK